MRENILNIEDLSIWYRTYRGYSKVVDHINLQVGKGEKIGLVGESGCGKTTTMKTVMGVLGKDLIHVPDGKIDFAGKNVLEMKQSELLQLRRTGISMISQSPMSALNPVFTIGQQLTLSSIPVFIKRMIKKPSRRQHIRHLPVLCCRIRIVLWQVIHISYQEA